MSVRYTQPSGDYHINPDPEFLATKLLTAGADYWEDGSGDAALQFNIESKDYSEIIFLLRDVGVFVQFIDPETNDEFVLVQGDGDVEIEITHCGDPWVLPRRFFVSRERANQAIQHFLVHGTMCTELPWVRF